MSPRLISSNVSAHRPRLSVVLLLCVLILLCYWASRLPGLTVLPLHNDEGLHLTRAVQVWNGNPFWEIRDGKIINHWLIAAFQPQTAPDFVGRFATIVTGAVGIAAAYALTLRRFGLAPALGAAALWIAFPYLWFYERLAFSDAQAGAWIVVALAYALRWTAGGRWRDAVLTGIALAIAALFKVTALPFALLIAAVIALAIGGGRWPLRRRAAALGLITLIGMAAFSVPVAVLLVRGAGVFDIAAGWIGIGGAASTSTGLAGNLPRFATLLATFGTPLGSVPIAAIALVVGVIATLLLTTVSRMLTLAALIPFGAILILGREVLPRHFVVALPLLLTLGGAGLGLMLRRVPQPMPPVLGGGLVIALAVGFIPFAMTSAVDPAAAALPAEVRAEHITDHSAGYGLREAVRALPMLSDDRPPVIGSMFPDSCRRANFYAAPHGMTMQCGDAPGTALIESALTTANRILVVVDSAPIIGLDISAFAADRGLVAEVIAAYPRPDDRAPSVVIWAIER